MHKYSKLQNDVFGEIRTCQVNNQIMFVGKDFAKALGYADQQKAIKMHVDDEDKLTRQIVVSGQNRKVIFINESGLYALILSSKLPQARTASWCFIKFIVQNNIDTTVQKSHASNCSTECTRLNNWVYPNEKASVTNASPFIPSITLPYRRITLPY